MSSTTRTILQGITLLEPWELTDAPLEDQLFRELDTSHPLYGIEAHAVARRSDNDDVLFEVIGAPHPLAVVHLTWGRIPDFPADYPVTQFYRSIEDWIENCMKTDHEEVEPGFLLVEALDAVKDCDSFLAFVRALAEDRARSAAREEASPSLPYGPDAGGWENITIQDFLGAAASWAEADDFCVSESSPVDPTWKIFAEFLYSGKIYE